MRRFLQWSHTFNADLTGSGRNIIVSVPLWAFDKGDQVVVKSCVFDSEFKRFLINATFDEAEVIRRANISTTPLEDDLSIKNLFKELR